MKCGILGSVNGNVLWKVASVVLQMVIFVKGGILGSVNGNVLLKVASGVL